MIDKTTREEYDSTPKSFNSEEEALNEIEALKMKYLFVSEYRVVTRKIEGKEEREEKRMI